MLMPFPSFLCIMLQFYLQSMLITCSTPTRNVTDLSIHSTIGFSFWIFQYWVSFSNTFTTQSVCLEHFVCAWSSKNYFWPNYVTFVYDFYYEEINLKEIKSFHFKFSLGLFQLVLGSGGPQIASEINEQPKVFNTEKINCTPPLFIAFMYLRLQYDLRLR